MACLQASTVRARTMCFLVRVLHTRREKCYGLGMHAGSPKRSKTRTPYKVKLKPGVATTLAEKHGVAVRELAGKFGLNDTTWARLLKEDIDPGEESIAAILGSDPDLAFDDVFEVVAA